MMDIDAGGLETNEFFIKLKDILASKLGSDVLLDITSNTAADAKKIKAFVLMTGCRAEIEKKGEHYVIHVTGSPCCI